MGNTQGNSGNLNAAPSEHLLYPDTKDMYWYGDNYNDDSDILNVFHSTSGGNYALEFRRGVLPRMGATTCISYGRDITTDGTLGTMFPYITNSEYQRIRKIGWLESTTDTTGGDSLVYTYIIIFNTFDDNGDRARLALCFTIVKGVYFAYLYKGIIPDPNDSSRAGIKYSLTYKGLPLKYSSIVNQYAGNILTPDTPYQKVPVAFQLGKSMDGSEDRSYDFFRPVELLGGFVAGQYITRDYDNNDFDLRVYVPTMIAYGTDDLINGSVVINTFLIMKSVSVVADLVNIPSGYNYSNDCIPVTVNGRNLMMLSDVSCVSNTSTKLGYRVKTTDGGIAVQSTYTILIVVVDNDQSNNVVISNIPTSKSYILNGESGRFTGVNLEIGKGTVTGFTYDSIESIPPQADDPNLIFYKFSSPKGISVTYNKIDATGVFNIPLYYHSTININSLVEGSIASLLPQVIVNGIATMGYRQNYYGDGNIILYPDGRYTIPKFDPTVDYKFTAIFSTDIGNSIVLNFKMDPTLRDIPSLNPSYVVLSGLGTTLVDLRSYVVTQSLRSYLAISCIGANVDYNEDYEDVSGKFTYKFTIAGQISITINPNAISSIVILPISLMFNKPEYAGVTYTYDLNIYVVSSNTIENLSPWSKLYFRYNGEGKIDSRVFNTEKMTATPDPAAADNNGSPVVSSWNIGPISETSDSPYSAVGAATSGKGICIVSRNPYYIHLKTDNKLYRVIPIDNYLPQKNSSITVYGDQGTNRTFTVEDMRLKSAYFKYQPIVRLDTTMSVQVKSYPIEIISSLSYNIGIGAKITLIVNIQQQNTSDIEKQVQLGSSLTLNAASFYDPTTLTDDNNVLIKPEITFIYCPSAPGLSYVLTNNDATLMITASVIGKIELTFIVRNKGYEPKSVICSLTVINNVIKNIPVLLGWSMPMTDDLIGVRTGTTITPNYDYKFDNGELTFTRGATGEVVTILSISQGTMNFIIQDKAIPLDGIQSFIRGAITPLSDSSNYTDFTSKTPGVRILGRSIYIPEGVTELDISYNYFGYPHTEKNIATILESEIVQLGTYYYKPDIPFLWNTSLSDIDLANYDHIDPYIKDSNVVKNVYIISGSHNPIVIDGLDKQGKSVSLTLSPSTSSANTNIHCFDAINNTSFNMDTANYLIHYANVIDVSLRVAASTLTWTPSTIFKTNYMIVSDTVAYNIYLDTLESNSPVIASTDTDELLNVQTMNDYLYETNMKRFTDYLTLAESTALLNNYPNPRNIWRLSISDDIIINRTTVRITDYITFTSGPYVYKILVTFKAEKRKMIQGVDASQYLLNIGTAITNRTSLKLYPYTAYTLEDDVIGTNNSYNYVAEATSEGVNIFYPVTFSDLYISIAKTGVIGKPINIEGAADISISVEEIDFQLILLHGSGTLIGKNEITNREWTYGTVVITMSFTAPSKGASLNSMDDKYLFPAAIKFPGSVLGTVPYLRTPSDNDKAELTDVSFAQLTSTMFYRAVPASINDLLVLISDFKMIYANQDNRDLSIVNGDASPEWKTETSTIMVIYLYGTDSYFTYRFNIKLNPIVIEVPPDGIEYTYELTQYKFPSTMTLPIGQVLENVTTYNIELYDISRIKIPSGKILYSDAPSGYNLNTKTYLSTSSVDKFTLVTHDGRRIKKYVIVVTKNLIQVSDIRIKGSCDALKPFESLSNTSILNVYGIGNFTTENNRITGSGNGAFIVYNNLNYSMLYVEP